MTAKDKPQRPDHAEMETLGRRRFLTLLSIGMGSLAAALAAVPVVGVIFRPTVVTAPPVWRAVGKPETFALGQTEVVTIENPDPQNQPGVINTIAVYVRREDEQTFTALSAQCSHLGCPVRWQASASLFLCPCHGGVYYADGERAAGPPPRGLDKHPVRIRDGQVEVRTQPFPIAGEPL